MAYQALYRKYRPASFDDVVGQRHIVQTLKNAIEKNRIAHAYLFCGPRGTGKTSIAKIFARTLNCTGQNKPCMVCENCRLSLAGSHPDIIEIDAASNNGVDEVRSLIDKVGYAPMEGQYKVYIIDEVHMMTSGAFNALLKTIEEPPAHVIFIFATTEPHKVLPTILSRCQRYDFSKVSETDIVNRLKTVCQSEEIQIEQDALELIADLADGGMRDALSILDQCAAYEQKMITADSVRDIYGVVHPSEFSRLSDNLTMEKAGEAVEFLKEIESKGMDLKRFTADLISLLKDSLLFDLAPNTPLIKENRREVIRESFSRIPKNKRAALIDDLMTIYNRFAYASSVMDYIETAILKSALWQEEKSDSFSYENRVDRSQIPMKTRSQGTEQSKKRNIHQGSVQNSDLSSLFWKSDVSRETIQNIQNPKSEIRFSEDFVLSLMAGANKEEKESDLKLLKKVRSFEDSLEDGKFARAIRGIRLYASGPNYLLVAAKNDPAADMINDLDQNQNFRGFMKKILGTPKKIFAVPYSEISRYSDLFRTRSKENSLPAPAVIQLTEADQNADLSVAEQLEKRIPDLVVLDD